MRGRRIPLGFALAIAAWGAAACGRQDPSSATSAAAEASAPALAAPPATGAEAVWSPPRNVLLVTLDTTRADYVSCLGGDPRNTPHLDALAADSALFTHATSETNSTNPSHVTLMTGLRAIDHGVISNFQRLDPERDTLPRALHRMGFKTAAFLAVAHLAQGLGWRGFDALPDVPDELEAAEVTRRALRWLRAQDGRQDERFFLWVHYYDAHTPYRPPPQLARVFYSGDPERGDEPPIRREPFFNNLQEASIWLGKARDREWPKAMYAAEIAGVDAELGRLLAELDRLGFADDTLVVVVADHGESLGEHGIFYDHKGLYEQQLRIPLIVHVPGLPPLRSDAAVSTLDVAPTIAALVGAGFEYRPTGLSLVPLLAGGAAPPGLADRVLVHQHAHNAAVAVRRGSWKGIWVIDQEHVVLSGPPQLFDLDLDPGELHDLAAALPQRLAELRPFAEPWLQLGPVPIGETPHLDEHARDQLRALGYTDG